MESKNSVQEETIAFFFLLSLLMSEQSSEVCAVPTSVDRSTLRKEKVARRKPPASHVLKKRPGTRGVGRARGHASREADRASEALPSASPLTGA